MPHVRFRFLATEIEKSLKWSPIVSLYGLRQVGKSTLAKQIVNKLGGEYATFDQAADLHMAESSPNDYLSRPRLFCIDEAQKAPTLFPALKLHVDQNKKPGQFLLTGSVRFTLKKEIREALTGRVLIYELLPFNLSESHQQKPSPFLNTLFSLVKSKSTPRDCERSFANLKIRFSEKDILRQTQFGGMPKTCFARDANQKKAWLSSYYETLIERDLALVDKDLMKIGYRRGMALLQQLAEQQLKAISWSELIRFSTLSRHLTKKMVRALEALSLIDLIPTDQSVQNAVRSPIVVWKDSGLWHHFKEPSKENSLHQVQALSICLSHEWQCQMAKMTEKPRWLVYENRNGGFIPWIFQWGAKTVAIHMSLNETPTGYETRHLIQYVKDRQPALGIVVTPHRSKLMRLSPHVWQVPITLVF